MDNNEKKLFIVLEEHLQERYSYMIKKYNFVGYNVGGFGDMQIGTSAKSIANRIRHRNILDDEYLKLKCFIDIKISEFLINTIYFSNSEGYIAYNILSRLKTDFPNLEFIGLQHGVFELSEIPKKKIRYLVNIFTKFFFNMYPIGGGFGSKIVDKYIVYNHVYKEFLINKHQWNPECVSVDLNFLKCELYDKKRVKPKSKSTTALFLLQCLSKAEMCSAKEEAFLNTEVVRYLKHTHDKVLIKNHPACSNKINLLFGEDVTEVNNLIDAFNECTHAYSFSSTTLLEAKIFDIKSYAINSKLVKEDKSIYSIFDNVLNFENEIFS